MQLSRRQNIQKNLVGRRLYLHSFYYELLLFMLQLQSASVNFLKADPSPSCMSLDRVRI